MKDLQIDTAEKIWYNQDKRDRRRAEVETNTCVY